MFVTGTSAGKTAWTENYVTVAYQAETGRQPRVSRYNVPCPARQPVPPSVAVNPKGTTVFVTGDTTLLLYLAPVTPPSPTTPPPAGSYGSGSHSGPDGRLRHPRIGGGQPGRHAGVRDRDQRRPDERQRLRHGGLPRLRPSPLPHRRRGEKRSLGFEGRLDS